MRRLFLLACLAIYGGFTVAQTGFSRADSLRGALRPERTAYDVVFYDLDIKVDPATRRISGSNTIHFIALKDFQALQVDLFANMLIDEISYEGQTLNYRREANAVFIDFPALVKAPHQGQLRIAYSGKPTEAARAPWDGGFVWKQDLAGKPWIGVACEGTGASLWWPNKDHLSDEPDSMHIAVTAPLGLKAVCNGNLRSVKDIDPQWTKWEWAVSYPINNYNVTLNIADYAHIHDTYTNASGVHDLDYYMLKNNEEKARKQFEQVKPMLEVFENFFGEYPFWRDGYALVETPYLGMEHQGAIAYGNHYLPGYDGYDPLDLKFDYIIIHESGHEWWGNSVSCRDHAELWIHEGFCTYSEAVYVEALWDRATADRYLTNQRSNILNLTPIVGPLDVNYEGWKGSDMYYKGAWMLHTLRNAVGDDKLWWRALRGFAEEFKRQVISTPDVVKYFNSKLGKDYTWLFDEYLNVAAAPVLEYKLKKKGKDKTEINCHWRTVNPDFKLQVPVVVGDGVFLLSPSTTWKKTVVPVPMEDFKFVYTTWYGKTLNVGAKK
jgi:aminopeptidase N